MAEHIGEGAKTSGAGQHGAVYRAGVRRRRCDKGVVEWEKQKNALGGSGKQ